MDEDINVSVQPDDQGADEYKDENMTAERPAVRRKKHRTPPGNTVLIIIILLILAAIAAAVILLSQNDDSKTEAAEIISRDYELSSRADFYTYGENIFFSTKDSMRLLDRKGSEKWVDSYTMMAPVMLGDKNVAALSDKNGSSVRVYNEAGLMYSVALSEPVVTFAVNGTGCLALISEQGSNYELAVYDGSGQKIYGGSYVPRDGIPMAIDVSDDGKMLAVSFMNISGLYMQSNVTFYYISSADTSDTPSGGGMFTSVLCEDCMPFMLRFTADGRCVALMDDRAVFIDPTVNGDTQKTEVPFNNRISYACVNGDGTLAAVMGEPVLNASDTAEANTVLWYNSKGEKVNEYMPDKTVTGLFPGQDVTVIGMGRSFEAYKTKGGSVWTCTVHQDTTKVLAYNGSDKILAVTPVKAVVVKAGKGNNIIGGTSDGVYDGTDEDTQESTAALPEGNNSGTEAETEEIHTEEPSSEQESAEPKTEGES